MNPGLGSMMSLICATRSSRALQNPPEDLTGRSIGVELLPGKPVHVVCLAELRELAVQRFHDLRVRPCVRSFTSMSEALKRFCHSHGGEITTSPPMNWLQCRS